MEGRSIHTVVSVFRYYLPQDQPTLAMAGWLWRVIGTIFVIVRVRIPVSTIYGSEDAYGFPCPENCFEIGSAMLSLVRYYQRIIHTTRRPIAPTIIRWALIRIIYTTTKDHHCFLVHSKSSRSTAHNPVLIVELSLKQRIKEVRLCAGASSATPVSRMLFWNRIFSNSLLHLSIISSISSITSHQHQRPADQHHHPADFA